MYNYTQRRLGNQKLVTKNDALVFAKHELRKSGNQELVTKIRRLCLQHINAGTHEHTIIRKDAALVFVVSTQEVMNSRC